MLLLALLGIGINMANRRIRQEEEAETLEDDLRWEMKYGPP